MLLDDDDFTLEDVSINQSFDDGLESTKIFDVVDLGKPDSNEWFKLYTINKKGLNGYVLGLIAKQKDAQGISQPYLILGNDTFRKKVRHKMRPTQYVRIAFGITTNERLFVWPLPVVDDINAALTWHATGWEIATAALSEWTQIQADKGNSRYLHFVMEKQGQVPKKDVFVTPPIDYITAIKKAFKGRIVKNEQHPIYERAGSIVASKVVTEIKKNAKQKRT